ncbi:MAG: SUMF1/EgtB/PvdO family nonheme iron enzyme [Anaerolineae bacterium]|nr:SUMF1/EgtB/PvdO family nonheme iron enzyme [Anaerolineae bacterium]
MEPYLDLSQADLVHTPLIQGSAIRAAEVALWQRRLPTIEAVAVRLGLRLAQVYAALAYCADHPEAVEAEWVHERRACIEGLSAPGVTHAERARTGDRLALLGDTRPGVGLRPDGLPDIDWLPVEGGEVELVEGAGHFECGPFHVARYPVTFAQYRAFLDVPDGYANDEWWAGLSDRAVRPGQQNRAQDNHPAENMSWYDAVAFCRWLSSRLGAGHAEGLAPGSGSWLFRLPAEWEWQLAATSGDTTHVFPWGPDWDGERANTFACGLNRSTAVGMYPAGASPCGALDLIGNVLEWCLNEYDRPASLNTGSMLRRSLRGAAWGSDAGPCGVACRYSSFTPLDRSSHFGFRLVAVRQ